MKDKPYKEDLELVERIRKNESHALDDFYRKMSRIIMEKAFLVCKKTCRTIPHHARFCPEKKEISSCEDFNEAKLFVLGFLFNIEKQSGPLLNYRAIASLKTYVTMVLEKYSPYLVMNWYRKKKRRYAYESHMPAAVKKLTRLHQDVYSMMLLGKGEAFIAAHLGLGNELPQTDAVEKTKEIMSDIKHTLALTGHMNKVGVTEVPIVENAIPSSGTNPESQFQSRLTEETLLEKHKIIRSSVLKLKPLERALLRLMSDQDLSVKEIAHRINHSSLKTAFFPQQKSRVKPAQVYAAVRNSLESLSSIISEENPDFFSANEEIDNWPGMETEKQRIRCLKNFLSFFGLNPGRAYRGSDD